jgi:hypothetical protein
MLSYPFHHQSLTIHHVNLIDLNGMAAASE